MVTLRPSEISGKSKTSHKSFSVRGESLLCEFLTEADPVEEAKHLVSSVSLIVWFVHRWQQDDFQELAPRIKEEVDLTPAQLKMIGSIRKTATEPEILRCVTEALNNPHAHLQGESDEEHD